MRSLACALAVAAALEFTPARRVSGVAPPLPPPTAVGWIEETVDLAVDSSGRVGGVELLRGTTSAATLLGSAVSTWRFRPATEQKRAVNAHVLAVALIRPPQLVDAPSLGSQAADRGVPSDELPYPTAVHRPRYPPLALGDAMVLVEALVGVDGRVRAATVVRGASGFNDEALAAARDWVFRPAHRNGEVVPAYAYLAFGFRRPV